MCTLALAWQLFEDAPVAVGANRDEAVDRVSEPPGQYATDPVVIAPRDAEAGGTWIGLNEYGVVAAITNRWVDHDLAGEQSRGRLVATALDQRTAADAAAFVEKTTAAVEYDGFILVVADANDAICLSWDGDLDRTHFEPGVHVVVNVGFDNTFDSPAYRQEAGEQQAANARRLRTTLTTAANTATDVDHWLDQAGSVLGDHEYGVCVHGDGFGTRSSSLLAVGTETRYHFADGPPCRTSYQSVDLEGQF